MDDSEKQVPQRETCVYCKVAIYLGIVVKDEWAHGSGSRWCQTPNGYTATPLREATPTYHGNEDVL
jgi:hypothetical protein